MSNFSWLNKDSRKFLSRGYLKEGVTAEERIRQIADHAEEMLQETGFADKFYDYMGRGWFSLSSPIWANFGLEALPVSCNGSVINDNLPSILSKVAEVGMMTKYGAGTSAYFGNIRPRGSKIGSGGTSSGSVHFMELFDKVTSNVSQTGVRRGAFAAYLDIEHPDAEEFLDIRSPGHPIQEMSFGICISDDFMNKVKKGDKRSKNLWNKVVQTRLATGYPYIFWSDTVNNNKPEWYKDKKINATNLCVEICHPNSDEESFVCTLSSMNLLYWDDWNNTDAVRVLFRFLDCVNEEYVQKTKNLPFMQAAHNFANNHKALGLGVLGWHSLLKKKLIAWESMEAMQLNHTIFKYLDEETKTETLSLGRKYGSCSVIEEAIQAGNVKDFYPDKQWIRNATRLAIAPTKSSSHILGQVSSGIEPHQSCYEGRDLAKGKFTFKDSQLKELLKSKGEDTRETWNKILDAGGSVQKLECLSEHEKNVYKTAKEISQLSIGQQAAQRQKFIDQSQSLNIFMTKDTDPEALSELLFNFWELGVKTVYYNIGVNASAVLAQKLSECSTCHS